MALSVAIRTHASPAVGIGHVIRSRRLAVALKKLGWQSRFFLDKENPQLKTLLHPFEYSCLYKRDGEFQNEESDALVFMEATRPYPFRAVIVDDYRLSYDWEERIQQDHPLVIVLDDCNSKSHKCAMLIDTKWTGSSTEERYVDKVPDDCIRLLGPKYFFMDELREDGGILTSSNVNDTPIIMLSLGGGGDMRFLAQLTKYMCQQAPEDANFIVRPVVGPLVTHKEDILNLGNDDSRVQPIQNTQSLCESLKSTNLYIGASGGTLYEVLSMNIPALTFSLAKNQYNEMRHLEDLGHYFHLNYFSKGSLGKLAELAWVMIVQLSRVRKLYELKRNYKIDGNGADRVARTIDLLERGKQRSNESKLTKNVSKNDGGYSLDSVNDQHVNRYLAARNLEENLKYMTDSQKVDQLTHYIWWLQSKRTSYILTRDQKPMLYIWHQTRRYNGDIIMTGGWFVCNKDCTAIDSVKALSMQLNITDKEFPDVKWVAVIKKNNHFVLSMNKRFGFEIIHKNNPLFKATEKYFPYACPEEFHYLAR